MTPITATPEQAQEWAQRDETPGGPFTIEQRDLLISSWLAIDPGLVDEFVEVTR